MMKRGRAAARARRKALTAALALAVMSAAVVPAAPGPAGEALAQSGSGIIVHSADGVLLRAEPAYGAEVLSTLAEGSAVGLRTDVADTVYDPDGVTQWWPVRCRRHRRLGSGVLPRYRGLSRTRPPLRRRPPHPRPKPRSVAKARWRRRKSSSWPPGTWPTRRRRLPSPKGVNLRQDPGSGSPAVKALSYQTVVELRVDEMDTVYAEGSRWWPVRIDGLIGWVAGQYLAPTESWAAPEAPWMPRWPTSPPRSRTSSNPAPTSWPTPTTAPVSTSAPTAPRTPSASASCRRTTSSRSWTDRSMTRSAIRGT